MKRRAAVIAVLAVTLAARETAAEIYRMKSPSTLKTEKGSELKLPPGYFLDEEAWRERDERMKKLEADRTRLGAENRSLRKSSTEYPWLATATVGAFGIVLGVFFVATADRW